MNTILIVEDDRLKFRVLRRTLLLHADPKETAVLWAPSVTEGLALLINCSIDAVITDMGLPMESGEVEVQKAGGHVVEEAKRQGIPVAVWTGLSEVRLPAARGWFSSQRYSADAVARYVLGGMASSSVQAHG